MIGVLNNRMLESSENFNLVVGLTMVLFIGQLSVLLFIGFVIVCC